LEREGSINQYTGIKESGEWSSHKNKIGVKKHQKGKLKRQEKRPGSICTQRVGVGKARGKRMNREREREEAAVEGGGRRRRNQDRGINDGAQRIVDDGKGGHKAGTAKQASRQAGKRRDNPTGKRGRTASGDTRMCRRCTRAPYGTPRQSTVPYIHTYRDDTFYFRVTIFCRLPGVGGREQGSTNWLTGLDPLRGAWALGAACRLHPWTRGLERLNRP
jgi:hypothetical protein